MTVDAITIVDVEVSFGSSSYYACVTVTEMESVVPVVVVVTATIITMAVIVSSLSYLSYAAVVADPSANSLNLTKHVVLSHVPISKGKQFTLPAFFF